MTPAFDLRLLSTPLPPVNLADCLRETGGVAADPQSPGTVYLGTWDHVQAAFSHPDLLREHPDHPVASAPISRVPSPGLIELDQTWPVFRDPPAHPPLRRALMAALTGALSPDRQERIAQAIQSHLRVLAAQSPFDAVELAHFVPSLAMTLLLGLDDPQEFQPLVVQMLRGDPTGFRTARLEVVDRLSDALSQQRQNRADTVLSRLDQALPDAPKATILSLALFLLTTGHGGVKDAIVNALWLAAQGLDGGALAQIRAPGAGAMAAFHETLRLLPPLRMVDRYVHGPIRLGPHQFNRGDRVYLMIGAALRDRLAFDDPDVFRLRPLAPKSLAFGLGPHACLGQHLAPWLWATTLGAVFAHGVPQQSGPTRWTEAPDESRLRALSLCLIAQP